MRRNPTKKIEEYRVKNGLMASNRKYGANGAFLIPYSGITIAVISSDGSGWQESDLSGPSWEHVSVSVSNRCPYWKEMDYIKRIFWRDDETVIQLHVPKALHINVHENCLHLWKPTGIEIPLPPSKTLV